MQNLLLSFLLFATLPFLEPKVEPWKKERFEGYVVEQDGFQLFGNGNKRLYLEIPREGYDYSYFEQLGFASQEDYKQAEKCIGSLVAIECYRVSRGSYETTLVPITMQERVK